MNHSLNSLRISGFPVDSGLRQFILFCFIDVIFKFRLGVKSHVFSLAGAVLTNTG